MANALTPSDAFSSSRQFAWYCGREVVGLVDLATKVHHSEKLIQKLHYERQANQELMKSLSNPAFTTPGKEAIMRRYIEESKVLTALIPSSAKHSIGKFGVGMKIKSSEKQMDESRRKLHEQKVNLALHVTGVETLPLVRRIATTVERIDKNIQDLPPHRQSKTSPPIRTMLPDRTPHFVGRKSLIENVCACLSGSSRRQRVALIGLGGSGKSQLALQVVQCLDQLHEMSVFWLDSTTELSLEQTYLRISSRAKLPEPANVQDVHDLLGSNRIGPGVMIFDGLDDLGITALDQVCKYLPQNPAIVTLFTSRNKACVDPLVDPQSIFAVKDMEKEEAKQLLRERSNDKKTKDSDVEELSDALNRFPLALEQAGAFIHTCGTNIAHYLQLYKSNNDSAQQLQFLEDVAHQNEKDNSSKSVARTWLISFQRIKELNPLAARQLCYMSALACCNIPREILLPVQNELEFIKAMGLLQAYSMIEAGPDYQNIKIHPLVHLVTKTWSSSAEADKKLAFDSVARHLPREFSNHTDIILGDTLLSHAQTVLGYDYSHEAKADLALRTSRLLQVKGSYKSALEFAQLAVEEANLQTEIIEGRGLLERSHLAWVHRCLGDFEEAYRILCEVLVISEGTLGSKRQETIGVMHDKSILLRDLCEYAEAESLSRQVLELTDEILGTHHDKFLKRLVNYGESLLFQKKYELAEHQYRRAVTKSIELLGPSNLTTLSSMSSLGVVLQEQEKWEEATRWHLKTLEGRTEILGSEHHATLKAKANLAFVHQGQHRYEEAEKANRDILEAYKNTLGHDHPDTLSIMYNLAVVLHHQDKLWEALECVQKVFEMRRIKLGQNHRLTVKSREYTESLKAHFQSIDEGGID